MKYKTSLKNEGLTEERATAVYYALEILHSALSKLDRHSLKQFMSLPIETRLSNFAQSEGLMDIIILK